MARLRIFFSAAALLALALVQFFLNQSPHAQALEPVRLLMLPITALTEHRSPLLFLPLAILLLPLLLLKKWRQIASTSLWSFMVAGVIQVAAYSILSENKDDVVWYLVASAVAVIEALAISVVIFTVRIFKK